MPHDLYTRGSEILHLHLLLSSEEEVHLVTSNSFTTSARGMGVENALSIYKNFLMLDGVSSTKALPVSKFSKTSRRLILEFGKLNWRAINTDIFGALLQTVIDYGARNNLGI